MQEFLSRLQIEDLAEDTPQLIQAYREYLEHRIRFLLERFDKYPHFPGVQTGYNSISGEEFPEHELFSYSWINGRGACVLARFARWFPEHRRRLEDCARHTIEAMEHQMKLNHGHTPFMANQDGTESVCHAPFPSDCKSYSDLYACFGFLECGVYAEDSSRVGTARRIFEESLVALAQRRFLTEPDPTPEDRILENPWSVALDLASEFAKQLNDNSYLEAGAPLVEHLLDMYYLPDSGVLVEYVTPEGLPFVDENGLQAVDPGHAIEFTSFAMEFSRLAERAQLEPKLQQRVSAVCPRLLSWNLARGWNTNHPGIYKTIDANSGTPIDDTMPWWILPETMLALLLAFERTEDSRLLEDYKRVNNTYFAHYMNPKTSLGPFQNRDGKTGGPVDIPPACKFQDPEFHSGKNLLSCIQVLERLRKAALL